MLLVFLVIGVLTHSGATANALSKSFCLYILECLGCVVFREGFKKDSSRLFIFRSLLK